MCLLPDCHVPLILSLQAVTRLFYLHGFGQFIAHAKVGTVVQCTVENHALPSVCLLGVSPCPVDRPLVHF